MHRNQLALQMNREFADGETAFGQSALQLAPVIPAVCGLYQIDIAGFPGRNLHAQIAERGNSVNDRLQLREARLQPGELG